MPRFLTGGAESERRVEFRAGNQRSMIVSLDAELVIVQVSALCMNR
jgi:hypothetical protein